MISRQHGIDPIGACVGLRGSRIQNIVNEQAWFIWLPTQILKAPVSSRFGNVRLNTIPPPLLRGIEEIFVRR